MKHSHAPGKSRQEILEAASAAMRSLAIRQAGGRSDRCRIVPVSRDAIRSDACLAERNSQQRRAQKHETGRRQGKKSVGDNVVVAHDTPHHSDARPNLLKLSESLVGTTRLSLCLKPAVPRTAKRSNLTLWSDSLQTHGQGKCPRSPGPLPL